VDAVMLSPRLRAGLRRIRPLTRLLFGVRVPVRTRQAHWDSTSLVMKKALDGVVRDGMRVLEVGTGESAVLSVRVARRRRVEVVAVDVSAEALELARQVVAANGVAIDVRRSDVLSGLEPGRTFDVIFSNPPYVPTEAGRRLGLEDHQPARTWDGGRDGLAVIRRLLDEAPSFLSRDGMLLVGFNPTYVDRDRFDREAAARGLDTTGVITSLTSTSVVYELRQRPAGDA
jgi:release factor glutamine methyltransferase